FADLRQQLMREFARNKQVGRQNFLHVARARRSSLTSGLDCAVRIPRQSLHREVQPPLIFRQFANQYLSHSPGLYAPCAWLRAPWRSIRARSKQGIAAPSRSGRVATDDETAAH